MSGGVLWLPNIPLMRRQVLQISASKRCVTWRTSLVTTTATLRMLPSRSGGKIVLVSFYGIERGHNEGGWINLGCQRWRFRPVTGTLVWYDGKFDKRGSAEVMKDRQRGHHVIFRAYPRHVHIGVWIHVGIGKVSARNVHPNAMAFLEDVAGRPQIYPILGDFLGHDGPGNSSTEPVARTQIATGDIISCAVGRDIRERDIPIRVAIWGRIAFDDSVYEAGKRSLIK